MNQVRELERLSQLDTNTISDALDFFGLQGATYGLRPLWDCPKIFGRASTIKVGRKTNATLTPHMLTPVIDAVSTDDRILVISGGEPGISCWGDIVANASRAQHIRGTVIDGVCRDIDGSREINYPVYGLGVTMISARNRLVQMESGTPVRMRGVTVNQDDYVIADNCGSVFIPYSRIGEVLDVAEEINRRQIHMLDAVRNGQSASKVMHDTQFEAIRTAVPSLRDSQPEKPFAKGPCAQDSADQDLVALFAGADTASVSDALDSTLR